MKVIEERDLLGLWRPLKLSSLKKEDDGEYEILVRVRTLKKSKKIKKIKKRVPRKHG